MKMKDVLREEKFSKFLGFEIEAYNRRPIPQEGLRYRRTPYDSLKDAGLFTVEAVISEFVKIANLESTLPRSQREVIAELVFRVAQLVVDSKAKEEARAAKTEE